MFSNILNRVIPDNTFFFWLFSLILKNNFKKHKKKKKQVKEHPMEFCIIKHLRNFQKHCSNEVLNFVCFKKHVLIFNLYLYFSFYF